MTDRVQPYYLYQQDGPAVPANAVFSMLYLNRVTSPLPYRISFAKATTYRHRVAATRASTHSYSVTARTGHTRTANGASAHGFSVVDVTARIHRVYLQRQNMVAPQLPRTMILPARDYWVMAPAQARTSAVPTESRLMEA